MSTPVSDNPLLPYGPYWYTPTFYICIIYITLFSLSTILHLGQSIYYRKWYLIGTMVMGGVGEIVGWSGRLWSSLNVLLFKPFFMQITSTITAPTFMSAANFIILGQIINRVGFQYSRLSATAYAIVFISIDLAALIVQAVGGASASQAAQNNGNPQKGGHIMLAGIVIQLFAITIYVALAAEFLYRLNADLPIRDVKTTELTPAAKGASQIKKLDKKLRIMIAALGVSSMFLFMRSLYRTIELSNGWGGPVITDETLFNVLDGMPITLAMWTLNIFHPGWLLREESLVQEKDARLAVENGGEDKGSSSE